MNTEPAELEEEYLPTSDVVANDGLVITPTTSPVKADLIDRPLSRFLLTMAPYVCFILGIAMVFGLGFALFQRHEITSTTYKPNGECEDVYSFIVSGLDNGEHPDIYAKYKADHPNATPAHPGCPIVYENNSRR